MIAYNQVEAFKINTKKNNNLFWTIYSSVTVFSSIKVTAVYLRHMKHILPAPIKLLYCICAHNASQESWVFLQLYQLLLHHQNLVCISCLCYLSFMTNPLYFLTFFTLALQDGLCTTELFVCKRLNRNLLQADYQTAKFTRKCSRLYIVGFTSRQLNFSVWWLNAHMFVLCKIYVIVWIVLV
jgi:hypothetical protein